MTRALSALVSLGVVSLLAACATEPAQTAAAEPGDGSVTCQEILRSGSNMKQRVCATEEEWREYERASRRASMELMRRIDQGSAVQTGD